jgi:ribosomal protein S18 acetylase RimI-like enzyme
MIDEPRPEEREKLVALTRATSFFSDEEVESVGEMLDAFFAALAAGAAPEYLWLVYRDEQAVPRAAGAAGALTDAAGTAGGESAPSTERPGDPLGYACYGAASFAVGVYDLYWIAVHPAHQDKKIGTALLEAVEADLVRRGARQLYIETSDKRQYAPTRAFYERRGYAVAAHFEDYYDVGDGKVVFLKTLG